MSSSRNGSLEVPSLQFPDSSLKNQSIISLDGFRSPSPLPTSPGAGGIPGDQDMLYELAESIQIDGTKVPLYEMYSYIASYYNSCVIWDHAYYIAIRSYMYI